MGFFSFLNFKKDNDFDFYSSYPLPNLNDLATQGKRDSFSNSQEIEHPLSLGNYELKLTHFWNKNYTKTQKELNNLEDQRNRLEFSVDTKNIKANLESKTHFNVSNYRNDYEHAHNEYLKTHQNYEEFKQDHHLRRLPTHFNAFIKTIIILVILFIIELVINEELFKVITGNDKQGQLEALFLSFTQTGINMITCFLAGRFLFGRILILEKIRRKAIDKIIFVSHILLIIYMNLFVGMYRALLEKSIEDQKILNTALWPFSHLQDFSPQSALVSGIGMVLALAAYFDGYFSDDSYPGYGNVARMLKKSKDDARSIYKKYNKKWDDAVKEFDTEKNKIFNSTLFNFELLSKVLNKIQKIKVDYEQLIVNMNKSYQNAFISYVQGFNSSSSKKSIVKSKDVFDNKQADAKITFHDVLNSENLMIDSERIKYIKNLKDKFVKDFNEEIDHLNKLNKEKTEQISQIYFNYKFQ